MGLQNVVELGIDMKSPESIKLFSGLATSLTRDSRLPGQFHISIKRSLKAPGFLNVCFVLAEG